MNFLFHNLKSSKHVLWRSLNALSAIFILVLSLSNIANATCAGPVQGIYNVTSWATGGSGISSSPWTGWETCLNSRSAGTYEIYFPAGYYTQGSQIVLQPGWTVRGAGQNSTIIHPSFASGSMFKSVSPINTSSSVNLRIEDLALSSYYTSSPNSGIEIITGTYVNIERVNFYGFAVGVWLDQAELVDIEECEFNSNSNAIAGIYLVSGDYHTAGANPRFTNRIGIRKNQFNGNGGTANYSAIYDEGGVAHMIRDNNFEGGQHALWVAGVRDLLVEGNEIENQTAEPIFVSLNIPNETSNNPTDNSFNIAITHNSMSPTNSSTYSSISLPAPSGSYAVIGVTISDNLMATTSGGAVSIAGVNNIRNLITHSNYNFSASSGVKLSVNGSGALQVQGPMTISDAPTLFAAPIAPPANTFYFYVDATDNKLKAKGSNGTITVIANP